ncbi:MAG: hypothetical protein KJ077_27445 [Anaerolineae bacterium]|nr:hypothetical protein [Anaerolineae bacterium]
MDEWVALWSILGGIATVLALVYTVLKDGVDAGGCRTIWEVGGTIGAIVFWIVLLGAVVYGIVVFGGPTFKSGSDTSSKTIEAVSHTISSTIKGALSGGIGGGIIITLGGIIFWGVKIINNVTSKKMAYDYWPLRPSKGEIFFLNSLEIIYKAGYTMLMVVIGIISGAIVGGIGGAIGWIVGWTGGYAIDGAIYGIIGGGIIGGIGGVTIGSILGKQSNIAIIVSPPLAIIGGIIGGIIGAITVAAGWLVIGLVS